MNKLSLFRSVMIITAALLAITAANGAIAQDMPLSEILIPGENWELVADGFGFTEGPAADADGNLYFTDIPASRIYKLNHATKQLTVFAENTHNANGLALAPNGLLYAAQGAQKRIVAYKPDGSYEIVATAESVNDVIVAPNGHIFFTDPTGGSVWHINPETNESKPVAENLSPNGLILAHQGATLVVTDSTQPFLWAFRVAPDGSLSAKSNNYGPVRMNPRATETRSDGMVVDDRGRLYLTSDAGLQVFDTQCRTSGVILKPQNKWLANVTFAGPQFNYLYVTCEDKIYRRLTQAKATPLIAQQ